MALGKISQMIQSSNIDVNLIEEVLDGLRDVFQQWVGFIIYLLIVSPQRSLIFPETVEMIVRTINMTIFLFLTYPSDYIPTINIYETNATK